MPFTSCSLFASYFSRSLLTVLKTSDLHCVRSSHFLATYMEVPVGWWRIRWRGPPPRSPTWPWQSWPQSLWWSHWAELTAGCLTQTHIQHGQRKQIRIDRSWILHLVIRTKDVLSSLALTPHIPSTLLSSYTLFLLLSLIPGLINCLGVSLEKALLLICLRLGVSHFPSSSSFSHTHLIKVWLMRMYFLCHTDNWF